MKSKFFIERVWDNFRSDFSPRRHESKCRAHFGSKFEISATNTPALGPLNILIFVNRSGSTLVSQYLSATGQFSAFGEPLNIDTILERSDRFSLNSFEEYLRHLYEEIGVNGAQVGMKASLDQILMLLRSKAIPNLFDEVRWIFLERLDVVSQAISFHIAKQTGRFYSHSGIEDDPVYDFESIRNEARKIMRDYYRCRLLINAINLPAYHLTYEKFTADPATETQHLSVFLGVPTCTIDTSMIDLTVQANQFNADFRERFKRDLASSINLT